MLDRRTFRVKKTEVEPAYADFRFISQSRHPSIRLVCPKSARSRLFKWCAKAARQYDYDNVLSFLGVTRDVSFPVRILDENSFSRREASHLSMPSSHMARSRSGGL
jgi:hypothetical protein